MTEACRREGKYILGDLVVVVVVVVVVVKISWLCWAGDISSELWIADTQYRQPTCPGASVPIAS
jgi:hypothetical protein